MKMQIENAIVPCCVASKLLTDSIIIMSSSITHHPRIVAAENVRN